MKQIKKLLSLVMAMIMVFVTYVANPVIAEMEKAEQNELIGEYISGTDFSESSILEYSPLAGEDVSGREEAIKVFRREDGAKEAVVYSQPVHYLEGKEWKAIDNTLELVTNEDGTKAYKNKSNDFKVSFAESFSGEKLVSIESKGHELSWKFVGKKEVISPETTQEAIVAPITPMPVFTQEPEITLAPIHTAEIKITPMPLQTLEAEILPTITIAPIRTAEAELPVLPTADAVIKSVNEAEKTETEVFDFNKYDTLKVTDAVAAVADKEEKEALTDEEKDMLLRFPTELKSEITYTDEATGLNVRYVISGKTLTEYITLNEAPQNAIAYTVEITSEDIIPVTVDGKTVFANKKGEEIFKMGTPVMFDATGEQSMDIDVVISEVDAEKNSFTYTLVPDMEWISSAEREYPLSIDPDIQASFNDIVEDTNICRASPDVNYNNDRRIRIGGEDLYQGLIKIKSLPQLRSGDVVIEATMNLTVAGNGDSGAYYEEIDLHKVTDGWTIDQVTWNTFYQPDAQPTIAPPADFQRVESIVMTNALNQVNKFDITSLVKSWYANPSSNQGVLLKYKPDDEAKSDADRPYTDFSAAHVGENQSRHPYFSVIYINSTGLEDRFTYNSHSLGRAGTGYVNVYSGNLTFIHDDATLNNGTMPINVSHVYNTNHKEENIGYGNGWRLNYAQSIEKVDVQNRSELKTYYKWTDGDGTEHYYVLKQGSTTKYVNELDKNSTLTVSGETITIKDKADNELVFDYSTADKHGRLTVMRDANGNEIRIAYTDSDKTNHRIASITEKNAKSTTTGSSISFAYNTARNLTSITPPDGLVLTYAYNTSNNLNNLIRISYADSRNVKYEYSNNCLIKAKNINNYAVLYEYSTEANSTEANAGEDGITTIYRVKKVSEQVEASTTTVGQSVSYEYTVNTTKVTNILEKETGDVERNTIYQFNTSGQPVSIRDAEGRAVYMAYNSGSQKTTEISAVSKMQSTVINLIKNHNFEDGLNSWQTESGTRAATAIVSQTPALSPYTGKAYAKLPAGQGTYIQQTVNVKAGKTYTFSAYLRGSSGTKVNLQVYNGNVLLKESGIIQPSKIAANTWVRGSVTFEVPGSCTSVTLKAITASSAVAYVDATQLEYGNTPNRYNLLENSDFSQGRYKWATKGNDDADGIVTLDNDQNVLHPTELTDEVYHLEGETLTVKRVYQTLPISGGKGDTYSFGAWVKTDSIALTRQLFENENGSVKYEDYGRRGLTFRFIDEDENYEYKKIYADATTTDWQYICGSAVASKDYVKILVSCDFIYTRNDCYFDGVQLHKEEFSQAYTYDENGNLKGYSSLLNNDSTFDYHDTTNDLLSVKDAKGNITNYTYDENHNMLTSTTPMGVKTSNSYGDNNGLITQTKVGTDSSYIQTDYEYNDYGLIKTVTDTFGESVTTEYDANKRQVTSTTDVLGNVTTYEIGDPEELNRQVGISSGDSSVIYTYGYDYLTKIESGQTKYDLKYNNFGGLTRFCVVSPSNALVPLVLNAYDYKRGLQTRKTYSNGLTVRYTYDDYDNVTQVKYGVYATYNYTYDREGNLYSASDSLLGRTTYYEYDHAGRCMASSTKNSSGEVLAAYRYQYDENNNLTSLSNTTGSNQWTTTYAYDKDNRPVTATLANGSKITNVYDQVGRRQRRAIDMNGDGTEDFTTSYVYFAGANNSLASNRFRYYINSIDGIVQYTYDANGNILGIKQGNSYKYYHHYDELNRLVRVDDAITETTWVYEYDDNGNIISKTDYELSSETQEPSGIRGGNNYTYISSTSTTGWKDQLVSYDGESIVYDAIGNPTTYRGYTMEWEGKRLTSAAKSGTSVTYAYDENGIRTRKTVNGTATNYYYHGSTLISLEKGTDTLLFSYDSNGQAAAVKYGTNYYYYVYNGQGDVIGLIDSSGAYKVQYVYDVWGKLYSTTGSMATSLGVLNPLRYRGYVYDEETKLYYLNSRYYDPETCRFISADEHSVIIAAANSLTDKNLYAYCDNNPVVRKDEGGEFWESVFDIFSLGVSIVEVCINPADPLAWAGLAGDAIDLIPFVTGVGEVIRAGKTVDKVADVVDTTHDIVKTANRVGVKNVIDKSANGIRYTDKVLKQMNNAVDLNHAFPSVIDTFVDINSGRQLKGRDGVMRKLIELPGSINNTPGVFEYIIEPNGMCNHRFFRELR